ncbi:hypothetical protein [Streptomyces canus]|uniref:hypothetical protein n=1 Tax=Streptomyces canus TaxID=58343 RepID=UPI0033BE3748
MEAWQHRFHQLQTDDRRNDELLRQLVDEVMVPALAAVTATERNAVKMTAKSSGHGRVYQSGRDQTINEG